MVLKFEEYINEGLWSKGLERAQTGEERLGDKVISNIEELKEVDLGFSFLFADKNLEINGDSELSYNDVKYIENYINKHGWRLMTRHDAVEASDLTPGHSDILFSFDMKHNQAMGVKARIKDTDTCLYLPLLYDRRYTYYLLNDLYKEDKVLGWALSNNKPNSTGRFYSAGTSKLLSMDEKVFVRLVKDK